MKGAAAIGIKLLAGLTEGRNIVLQILKKCVRYLLEEIEPPKPNEIIYEHERIKTWYNIVERRC